MQKNNWIDGPEILLERVQFIFICSREGDIDGTTIITAGL